MLTSVGLLLGVGLNLAKLKPESKVVVTDGASPHATASKLPTLPVAVFNGTKTAGLARQVSDTLAARGWVISQVANWPSQPPSGTTIYYPTGYQEIASELAKETSAVISPVESDQDQTVLTLVVMK